jgi:RNA-binding protein
MALTSGQRKFLRSLAHPLEPLALLGKHGLSDSFVNSVAAALDAHELVKLRFNDFKDDKKELLAELTQRTESELVGLVGHVATLYKRQEDDKRRKIELPG